MSALTDVFTAIANAIRAKNGASTTYKPSQMADAINSIVLPTSEVIWENSNITADFPAQTITVSKTIPKQSYLKISYLRNKQDYIPDRMRDYLYTGYYTVGPSNYTYYKTFGMQDGGVGLRYIGFRPGDTRSEGKQVIISDAYYNNNPSGIQTNLTKVSSMLIPVRLEIVSGLWKPEYNGQL